jgi:hypothetical protein
MTRLVFTGLLFNGGLLGGLSPRYLQVSQKLVGDSLSHQVTPPVAMPQDVVTILRGKAAVNTDVGPGNIACAHRKSVGAAIVSSRLLSAEISHLTSTRPRRRAVFRYCTSAPPLRLTRVPAMCRSSPPTHDLRWRHSDLGLLFTHRHLPARISGPPGQRTGIHSSASR